MQLLQMWLLSPPPPQKKTLMLFIRENEISRGKALSFHFATVGRESITVSESETLSPCGRQSMTTRETHATE